MYHPSNNAVHKLPQKPVFPSWEDGRPSRDHPSVSSIPPYLLLFEPEINLFDLMLSSMLTPGVSYQWYRWDPASQPGQVRLNHPIPPTPVLLNSILLLLGLITNHVGCGMKIHIAIASRFSPSDIDVPSGGHGRAISSTSKLLPQILSIAEQPYPQAMEVTTIGHFRRAEMKLLETKIQGEVLLAIITD